MAYLVSPIVDIISRLWTCCARHTRYLCKLQQNLILLRNAMKELTDARNDVLRRVIEAEADLNEPKLRTDSVSGWLQSVEKIEREVDVILEKADDEQQLGRGRCVGVCCPPNNCWNNYKVGKSITKKIPLVNELKGKGDFPEVTYVARPTSYVSKLQENKILLRNAMAELKEARDDVQRRVVAAEADPNEPKKRTDSVSGWLQRVETIEGEMEVILQTSDEQLSNAECHEKDKLVVMKKAYVDELKVKGDFQDLTYRLPPPSVQDMNLESTVGMESMFDKVWRLITTKDDKVVRIMGLHGHGGVGKTTLLKKINNEFSKISGHDVVMFVVVSKPINYEAIQKKIGKNLGLSFDKEDDESSRADKIFKQLRKKNFVILLDDIWERVDLQRIGIPSSPPPPQGNSSKIIFTTRNKQVCGLMEATHQFQVECLPWDKAWRLFEDKVGEEALTSFQGARESAKVVAKECGGLPLALITIGRAMSTTKSAEEWKDAITTLKNSASEFPGMGDEVLPRLKLSYDNLRNETIKSCFLYCALFPEDHSIRIAELIDYWIGEGFLNRFDNLDEARSHGDHVIETLKRACLLESCEVKNYKVKETYVKMHDIIRDLAIWIVNDCKSSSSSTTGKFLVASNVCERWRNAERIFWTLGDSSNNNDLELEEPPPPSPNLRTLLLLQRQGKTFSLPQSFFQFTPFLRVLDMSNTKLAELPTSICELYELQYLNLSDTGIKELPIELRKLVKLKFLDLTRTKDLRKIPPGVIANLSELQVLKLAGLRFMDWWLKEEDGGLSLGELDKLKQLQEVTLSIITSFALKELLCNQKLQRICTNLVLKSYEGPYIKSISLLPPSPTTSKGSLGNLTSLKYLNIESCYGLEELILFINDEGGETNTTTTTSAAGFPISNNNKLEVLNLDFLPRLNNIVWGAAAQQQQHYLHYASPFQNLYSINIITCEALKNLTSVVYVENLENLDVYNCDGLETIIELGDDHGLEGASGGGCRVFRRLKTLKLMLVPNLKSICSHALVFPSIQTIDIYRCPELKKLPLDSRSNINNTLQVIEGSKEWWNKLQWEDETVKSKFLPYIQETNLMLSRRTVEVFVRPESVEIIAAEVNKNLQKDDDQHEPSMRTEQVFVRTQSIEIIAAEMDKNLHKDDDQHEQSKHTGEVAVRLQSVEIIAAEVDKNLQKDDNQHEPRKRTEEVAISPQSINIIAANMDKNLKEIATRPQTVEIIAAEVDKNLQKDYRQTSRGRCLGGFFPKSCWRSNYKKKLGKLVAQKKMRKVEMKQKSLGMAGYMFEKAWSLLGEDDDDEIRIMGLYGQGGVGKTTLLKQINNEFIKSRYQRDLDIVILVLVSKPIKVEVIQKKIGESLKLSLEGDESRRAEEIFKVLKNKNFVLLLDDIWERIDLQCIGVPRPQGKSKIIFTTRSKIVCRLMEADKTFKVECLPWNKAWSLFQENVGEEALNSEPRVPELAKIIARECVGLPLALITIGQAMSSKKSLQEWNDTITTLREFRSGYSGICDEGLFHLKLSYDNLHSETIKSCFLYCSLYPEHHSIPKSQLIDFWIGEGIFQWVDDIDEVRNRAYDIIENLKGAFLLESGEDEETSVKMHDVIRDLALWIVNEFGRRKDKSLVEIATGTPNTSDKWENAERIYLSVDINTKEEEEEEAEIQNDIQMETPPRYPNLLTLMVHGNSYYADLFLPQKIFQFMPLLRVLDFSELEMEEFPTSITGLVELQYLGLAKTNIEELPDELRKLVKLKYLDLSHTYFLKKIPPGVITSLSELRVFNQYHSDFGDWEEDGPSLRELTSLKHLDDLGITIKTVLALQRLLRNRKLRMCTRRLTIDECINLKSLALLSSSTTTTTLSLGNLKRLKELACQNCSALAELTMNWAVVEDGHKGLLSNLETLTLWNLPKLNVVWEKQYVCSSFQNLKEISIVGCNALKDLTWLVYVRNLETLYLRKCQEVKEILDVDGFGRGGDEMLTRDVVFKELKNIYMGNLVRLERICKYALAFPSLKSMVVKDCPHLKKLPLDCDSNINNTLQRIEGGTTWWNRLYWEDDQVKSKFLPYFEE